MGNLLSALSESNPSSSSIMSSTKSPSTRESRSYFEPTHQSESAEKDINVETQEENREKDTLFEENKEGGGEEGEDEEEGECGFCLFMKGGGCKDAFVEWENCIQEGEKNKEDIVEKCFEVTSALKKCMEAHSDYYAPILEAEKAAEAEALKELEKEKEEEEKLQGVEGKNQENKPEENLSDS